MLALILVVCITAVTALGTKHQRHLHRVNAALTSRRPATQAASRSHADRRRGTGRPSSRMTGPTRRAPSRGVLVPLTPRPVPDQRRRPDGGRVRGHAALILVVCTDRHHVGTLGDLHHGRRRAEPTIDGRSVLGAALARRDRTRRASPNSNGTPPVGGAIPKRGSSDESFQHAGSQRFLTSEDGPTAVEYAVMLALILVVCIATVTTLGTKVNDTFEASTPAWTPLIQASRPRRDRRTSVGWPRPRTILRDGGAVATLHLRDARGIERAAGRSGSRRAEGPGPSGGVSDGAGAVVGPASVDKRGAATQVPSRRLSGMGCNDATQEGPEVSQMRGESDP